MYVVYIIQSQSTKKIYIGFTVNLKRRLFQHNNNEGFSTKNKGPWKLIYCEAYGSREDAKARESNLKYHGKALGQLKRRMRKSFL